MPLETFNGLTIKQAGFVKEYIENGGNGVQAALSIYDTKDYRTANTIAVENLQKPAIQEAIEDIFEDLGLSKKQFFGIIAKKVKSEHTKDHKGYCQLLADVTGWKAPLKTENKNDNTVNIVESESEQIAKTARESVQKALVNEN